MATLKFRDKDGVWKYAPSLKYKNGNDVFEITNGLKYKDEKGVWHKVNICGSKSDDGDYPTISTLNVGSSVYLNENGSPAEFIIATHNYEPNLNGAGRTLLVRKNSYKTQKWHYTNINAYATSNIDSWLNTTYKSILDNAIQEAIGTTTFYYTKDGGSKVVTTLSRSIFLPSITEFCVPQGNFNVEGSAIPSLNNFITSGYAWTRTPSTIDGTSVCALYNGDKVSLLYAGGNECPTFPCFTIPNTILFDPNTNTIVG